MIFTKGSQSPDNYRDELQNYNFEYFVPFLPTKALAKGGFVCFVVKMTILEGSISVKVNMGPHQSQS
jgi:hypothetical protein